MSLRLRVTYGRALDFLTDMEEQVSRRGLLVRVDVGTDIERGAPAELEVVTPVGRMTIQASVIQVLQGVGVAVEVDPDALVSLAESARRAPRDPGPAPRFERLKDGPPVMRTSSERTMPPTPRTPTGERTMPPTPRTPTGERTAPPATIRSPTTERTPMDVRPPTMPPAPRSSTIERSPPAMRSPTIDRTTTPPATRSPTIERTATPPSGTRVVTPAVGTPKEDTLPPVARKPTPSSMRPVTIMTEGAVPRTTPPSGPIPLPKPRAGTTPPTDRMLATERVSDTSPPGVLRAELPSRLPASSDPAIKLAQKSEPGITPLGARPDRSELGTIEGSQRLGRQSTNPPVSEPRARTVTPVTGTPIRTQPSPDSFITFTPASARPIPSAPPPDDDEPELSYETTDQQPPPEDEPAEGKPVFGLGSETTPTPAQVHAQKIQLALHGDKNARAAILRDTNKMLHTYVLRNPQLQIDEIVTIAKMSTTSIEMLSAIAARREWAERTEVALALVRNPKTPIPLAVRMLDHLGEADLRTLAKQQNVRDAVQRAARKKILG